MARSGTSELGEYASLRPPFGPPGAFVPDLQKLLESADLLQRQTQLAARDGCAGDRDFAAAVSALRERLPVLATDDILDTAVRFAQQVTKSKGAAIALGGSGLAVCRARAGAAAPAVGAQVESDTGLSGQCLRTGQVLSCDDTESDPRVIVAASRALGIRSVLVVPIRREQQVVGILEVFSSWVAGFGPQDIHRLKVVADVVADELQAAEKRVFRANQTAAPAGPGQAATKPLDQGEVAAREASAVASIPPTVEGAPVKVEANTAGTPASAAETKIAVEARKAEIPALATISIAVERHRAEIPRVVATGTPFEVRAVETPVQVRAETAAKAAQVEKRVEAEKLNGPARLDRPGRSVQQVPTPVRLPQSPRRPTFRIAQLTALLLLGSSIIIIIITVVLIPHFRKQTPLPGPPEPLPLRALQVQQHPPVAAIPGTASNMPVQLLGVATNSRSDFTALELRLESAAPYTSGRLHNPERIYFDVANARIGPGLSQNKATIIEVGDKYVRRVRVAEIGNAVRVVLDLNCRCDYTAVVAPSWPPRLMVEIHAPSPSGARVPLPPEIETSMANIRPQEEAAVEPRWGAGRERPRIVIDPGHGGGDLGTVGHSGLQEKDLVLDVAQRVGTLIAQRTGAEVVYTRTDDSFVPLQARSALANAVHADLFVSLHANASYYASVRGVETFYVNPNSAKRMQVGDGQELTMRTFAAKVSESRHLAAAVQHALYGRLAESDPRLRDRGVKPGSLIVLIGPDMPAILSEISFVSSPSEERKLSDPAYRDRIAEALFGGINAYLQRTAAAARKTRAVLSSTSRVTHISGQSDASGHRVGLEAKVPIY